MDGAVLQARIDESGFGPFQLLMLLLTGGIMFAEGAEMLVMGSITTFSTITGSSTPSCAVRWSASCSSVSVPGIFFRG
jgi:hypothetical protein